MLIVCSTDKKMSDSDSALQAAVQASHFGVISSQLNFHE